MSSQTSCINIQWTSSPCLPVSILWLMLNIQIPEQFLRLKSWSTFKTDNWPIFLTAIILENYDIWFLDSSWRNPNTKILDIFSYLIPGFSIGNQTSTIFLIWILDNLLEEFFPIWILDNSESLCSQPVCPWCLYIYRSLYRQTFKRILFSFSTLADCCEIQRTWDFKQFLIWIMCKCWKGIWKSTLNGSSHLSGISVISVRLITYHRPHLSFEIHFEIAYN